ncbi:MAG: hypothetical protein ABI446_01430 [Gemmatimonadaceae bacterium]
MSPISPPPKGSMYLFDSVTPPLVDGSYRVTVETDVSTAGAAPTFTQQRYFDVIGPRFSVPASMVAMSYPPRNAHGAYQNTLPQIVLSRRTLPWERDFVPSGTPLGAANAAPTPVAGDAPPLVDDAVPWVALLVFEEGEYTFLRNVPLEQVLPTNIFAQIGSPAGITCDAVEASHATVTAIMPSRQELQLLSHVRWVNVDDRELNVASGDGWFSVVVSSRMPTPGAKCRAVLVSLEGRADVVQENPPAIYVDTSSPVNTTTSTTATARTVAASSTDTSHAVTDAAAHILVHPPRPRPPVPPVRLVALTSWQFSCEGTATFQTLMQNLVHEDEMIGAVDEPGRPAITDTGHIPMGLRDRVGAVEQVLYRGPLVPYQLTRDPLGPYHSADQARRVSPDTGAEDISYAAAFEAGRLLAAADARFAQAAMQWRREAYKQSARANTIAKIASLASATLPATLAEALHTPLAPIIATAAAAVVVQSNPPVADAYGLRAVAAAPGLDPAALTAAWSLASVAQARGILGADVGALGAVVASPELTPRPNITLAAAAADTAALAHLSDARTRAIANPPEAGGV